MNKDFETAFQEWVDKADSTTYDYDTPFIVKDWILANLPKGGAEEILKRFIVSFPEDDRMTDESIKRNVYKAMSIYAEARVREERERWEKENLSYKLHVQQVSKISLELLQKENAELKERMETQFKINVELQETIERLEGENEDYYQKGFNDGTNFNFK
jgi:hypothetical protein